MLKILISLLFAFPILLSGQTAAPLAADSSHSLSLINVFIDCEDCNWNGNFDFFRQNFSAVNYMRNVQDAEVFVLMRNRASGSGGLEHTMIFNGVGPYKYNADTLLFFTRPDATPDDIRQVQIKSLKAGLLPYLLKKGFLDKITIEIEQPKQASGPVKDPWNWWVFNYEGGGFFSGDANYSNINVYNYFTANRITDEMKLENGVGFNINIDKYKLEEGTVINNQKNYWADHLFVRSVNQHWSIGEFGDINSSIFSNLRIGVSLQPAIEYDLYPYKESATQQLRFLYGIGGRYNSYFDTTIYFKTSELLPQHKFRVIYGTNQKWGKIESQIRYDGYLHNFNLYNITALLAVNVRVAKGLSIRIGGVGSLNRDQINLKKINASRDDVLLRQRELQSRFDYLASIGFSYNFGSQSNNFVNPRFNSANGYSFSF